MDPLNKIISDLLSTTLQDVVVMPPPYHSAEDLDDKVMKTYQQMLKNVKLKNHTESLIHAFYLGEMLTKMDPKQQTFYRKVITKHYFMAATRAFWLFEAYGPAQIYRTKSINIT
ncbi:8758_t:CDS:1, partial [Cetraspora pellucida]